MNTRSPNQNKTMTLPQMTPDEKRIAVAEWLGWEWKATNHYDFGATEPRMAWHNPDGKVDCMGDFTNDLNAIVKACWKLSDRSNFKEAYIMWLKKVIANVTGFSLTEEETFRLANATASQRVDALLMTIGRAKL